MSDKFEDNTESKVLNLLHVTYGKRMRMYINTKIDMDYT